MPTFSLKDWRGTPIIEGCTIVYPGRVEGDMWMNEAVVVGIEERTVKRRPRNPLNWDEKLGIPPPDPDKPNVRPVLRVHRTRSTQFLSYVDNTVILTVLDRVTVIP